MSSPPTLAAASAAPSPVDARPRLTLHSVAVALALGTAAAAGLDHIFITPFPILLGRLLFLAMTLLLVYVGTGWVLYTLLPARVPNWVRQTLLVVAVAVAAPLAAFGGALMSAGGDLMALLETPARLLGFFWIASVGLIVGLVLTAAALLRERETQQSAQTLQFALERSTLERQVLDARLNLLQAQIEPHFLFNTLANVQALVESGSPRAAPVLASLIAYLRAAMPRLHGGAPTLGDEAALVRAYLSLMQMRMPDRLQAEVDISDALAARRFPAMALLTLVENAVRHGIDPAEDGGRISVGARAKADGGLCLWVADTGVGMADSAVPGTGLNNVRDRLAAFYGPTARLELSEVSDGAPHGLRAELHIPPPGTGVEGSADAEPASHPSTLAPHNGPARRSAP